ncbi:MAG: MFS transporter [Rhodobacter sp.]|nr:MFS transporter [Rhodobacter sp.]
MGLTGFLRDNAPFLAAGALLAFCSSFGQTYLISVFAGVIQADFGLSHGEWGGIYTIGTTASAVAMIWAGVATDHVRARALGAVVLVALALACLAMALAPAAWALPFVIFALRFAGQGMTTHIAVVAMARWFTVSRGKAISIALMGFAVGEAFLPLAIVPLLGIAPWRALWVGFAVFLVLMAPVLYRLLRLERTPRAAAEEAGALGMGARHWRRPEALRHWLFWMVAPAILAPSAFGTAFFFQQVHLAETKGWAHLELVALFPLFTGTSIAAMLVSGWLIDRLGSARLMPVAQIPVAVGFLLMGAAESLAAAGLAVVLMGASQGALSTLSSAFWAEFYGTRHLGGIKALATAVMVLGSAIGPGLTGVLIDFGVVFEDQMAGIAGVYLGAAALVAVGVTRARRLLPVAA